MMNWRPQNPQEVQEAVLAADCLLARGGGTKPALSTPPTGVALLDLSALTGIIEYDPNEYTFTALAATPLRVVVAQLAEHGQYLPFDPILVEAGATLGGTVAANASGSGRYRYGGVRDFILGIQFVDGLGQLVRSGGKVVKNSAGFDLSKFMVGSLGRYGILTEISFKVFPRPRAYTTLDLAFPGLDSALAAALSLATYPFDMDAVDMLPQADGSCRMLIRLGGLDDALPARVDRLGQYLRQHTEMARSDTIAGASEAALWADINALAWAADAACVAKIPLPPRLIPELENRLPVAQRHYAAGGHVVWVASADAVALHAILSDMQVPGLLLRGGSGDPILGERKGLTMAARVKKALDPHSKFMEA